MSTFNQNFAIIQPSLYGNSKFGSHNQRLSFYAHSKYSTSYQATVLAFQRFTNVTVSGLTGTAWDPADPSYLSPPHPRCNKCSTHYYPTFLSSSSSLVLFFSLHIPISTNFVHLHLQAGGGGGADGCGTPLQAGRFDSRSGHWNYLLT